MDYSLNILDDGKNFKSLLMVMKYILVKNTKIKKIHVGYIQLRKQNLLFIIFKNKYLFHKCATKYILRINANTFSN